MPHNGMKPMALPWNIRCYPFGAFLVSTRKWFVPNSFNFEQNEQSEYVSINSVFLKNLFQSCSICSIGVQDYVRKTKTKTKNPFLSVQSVRSAFLKKKFNLLCSYFHRILATGWERNRNWVRVRSGRDYQSHTNRIPIAHQSHYERHEIRDNTSDKGTKYKGQRAMEQRTKDKGTKD